MAAILQFLSPRTAKALDPVYTLAQSTSSITISVRDVGDQFDSNSIVSPYSHIYYDSNQRTRNQFRPRNATKGTTSYQLRQYAEATLGGGSLRKTVRLPEGEDENEWLAVNSNNARNLYEDKGLIILQWWTSTIISICSMDQSPSSALQYHAQT